MKNFFNPDNIMPCSVCRSLNRESSEFETCQKCNSSVCKNCIKPVIIPDSQQPGRVCLTCISQYRYGMRALIPSDPEWQSDDDIRSCSSCGVEFGFFTRKHHCRFCGKIYCANCLKNKTLINGKQEYSCNNCFRVGSVFRGALARRKYKSMPRNKETNRYLRDPVAYDFLYRYGSYRRSEQLNESFKRKSGIPELKNSKLRLLSFLSQCKNKNVNVELKFGYFQLQDIVWQDTKHKQGVCFGLVVLWLRSCITGLTSRMPQESFYNYLIGLKSHDQPFHSHFSTGVKDAAEYYMEYQNAASLENMLKPQYFIKEFNAWLAQQSKEPISGLTFQKEQFSPSLGFTQDQAGGHKFSVMSEDKDAGRYGLEVDSSMNQITKFGVHLQLCQAVSLGHKLSTRITGYYPSNESIHRNDEKDYPKMFANYLSYLLSSSINNRENSSKAIFIYFGLLSLLRGGGHALGIYYNPLETSYTFFDPNYGIFKFIQINDLNLFLSDFFVKFYPHLNFYFDVLMTEMI